MRSQTSKQLPNLPLASDGRIDPSADVCQATIRCCVSQCSQDLRSIVLTGSMARQEGTYTEQQGHVRVLGDAEFVLVFRNRAAVPSAELLGRIRHNIESCLAENGISCRVGLSAVPPTFLTLSEPHIFAYELRTLGKVIWGEPGILDLMPVFRPADIPLEDGWRLLQNRMVEMLQLPDNFWDSQAALPAETQYRAVKLYLDMATSFLLFAGAYAPSFGQRAQRLGDVGPGMDKSELPFALDAFTQQVNSSTTWKLGTAAREPLDRNSWLRAVAYARGLWRWELARLTGLGSDAPDKELFFAWMRRQPCERRLRGWLFVIRHQGWLRSWRSWPHWAPRAWRASPRYWIYLAASQFLFALADAIESGRDQSGGQFAGVLDSLPLRSQRRSNPGWAEIAREICFNYDQLLVETRS